MIEELTKEEFQKAILEEVQTNYSKVRSKSKAPTFGLA